MPPLKSTMLTNQLASVVITAIVTMLLTLAIRSGVVDERQSRGSKDIENLDNRLSKIETEGSPVERAQREAIEKSVARLEKKVDDIYTIIVEGRRPVH